MKAEILIIILSVVVMLGIVSGIINPCWEWCSVCGAVYCNKEYGPNNWEIVEYRCGSFWLKTSLTCMPKEGLT